MMRKKCLESGEHKLDGFIGIPYVFCRRWFCSASAVSMWAQPSVAVALHNAIPRKDRVPAVKLGEGGEILEQWDEGTG